MIDDLMTAPSLETTRPLEMPDNATFLWRKGLWHMQASGHSGLTPVPARAAKVLDQLKRAGQLAENSPGLFRLSNTAQLAVVDDAESPLMRLARLRQPDGSAVLDREQLRAGERLRVDYERAHLGQRVTTSYEPSGSSGGRQAQFSDNHIEKLNDGALAARQKLHQALEAVGPELSGILLHVCCMAGGLEQAEMRLNLPRRAGKAVLQLALTRLARHYGFKQHLQHAGPARIGHWATGDFRPQILPQPAHQP